MRSIIPSVFLLLLSTSFVITGCKDFPSGDDDMAQEETMTKREGVPIDTSNQTPDDSTGLKFKEKPIPAPAAIPVVTQEEAERMNFFAVFRETVKKTVVEGEIIERSELPDPKGSDYPNCRFTMHFRGNSIKSGESCPKELSLIADGFEDYRMLPNNDIKTGDKVLCSIIPFEQLPEDFQSTQQADDLELFLLDSYYVLNIRTIQQFSDNDLIPVSGILFSDGNEDYISIFDRHINPPIPDQLKKEQTLSIQKDLDKMNRLLDGINDETIQEINKRFIDAWSQEKAKDPPKYNRVGDYVWRNVDNSFWTLPVETDSIVSKPNSISQRILDCFLSLKQVLEANGVQLIVSLVPRMNVISARVINKDFKDVPDIETATYVKQLSEIGVETIYATDQLISNHNRFPFAFFIPDNPHPSDTTQDVLSDILEERLKRYGVGSKLDRQLFLEVQSPHTYKSDEHYCFPQKCDIGDNQAGEPYTCRNVLYDGETIKRTKESPIMVIGNSFIETPISSPESLPTLLSYKLHTPIDWHRVSGYGPFSDILIQLLSNPEFYLKNKKVFIFQVGTMHMTGVNRSETMVDIAKIDKERLLLNKKIMKGHCFLQSNVDGGLFSDPELWGSLSTVEKTVLKVDENGELTYSVKLEDAGINVADTAPIVCVIPHMCVRNTTCKLTVNGTTKAMHSPNYAYHSRFFNLAYEFPAGTKEISIKVEGKPGTLFAIKDIQIWQ